MFVSINSELWTVSLRRSLHRDKCYGKNELGQTRFARIRSLFARIRFEFMDF